MRRLSLHLGCWFGLAVLALALAASNAGAQMSSVSVTASAGPFTPDWCPAPTDQSSPASAPLTASVANPPVPPYGCSLMPPTWFWSASTGTVLYSPDNSTWSAAPYGSYSFWIVQPDNSSPAATAYVLYNIGGYWQFPCEVGVWYNDSSCGDMWSGNTTCMADGKSVQLISLTVVSGATQTNVTGPAATSADWAAVKKTGDTVIALAVTLPNNADAWAQIQWTGGNAVAGNANERSVDKGTSAMTTVKAQIGQTSFSINIWIIWCSLSIFISGTLHVGNDAANLQPGTNWPDNIGGGYTLGPIDCKGTPKLTYRYTVGRMEAQGYVGPDGIEDVITRTAWDIKRNATGRGWDNGGHYTLGTWMAGPCLDWTNHGDTSDAGWKDLDPQSGTSSRDIYDVDAPGCAVLGIGREIRRTSEIYFNMTQWITVTLDSEQKCSDDTKWSYKAQVDGDYNIVDANALSTDWIDIPDNPHYKPRN